VLRKRCGVRGESERQRSRRASGRCLYGARRTAHRARRPQGGFTLIELIVVLIGLAVVAAAVVPSLAAAGRQGELDRVAARVAASARFARETAIEHQAALVMTVETAPDVVRLAWDADAPQLASLAAPGSRLPAGDTERGSWSVEPGTAPKAQEVPLPRAFAIVPLPARVAARVERALEESVLAAPAQARAASADPVLRFPADGRTGGGVILLTDDRGRERRVVLAPQTGVVRIEDGDE